MASSAVLMLALASVCAHPCCSTVLLASRPSVISLCQQHLAVSWHSVCGGNCLTEPLISRLLGRQAPPGPAPPGHGLLCRRTSSASSCQRWQTPTAALERHAPITVIDDGSCSHHTDPVRCHWQQDCQAAHPTGVRRRRASARAQGASLRAAEPRSTTRQVRGAGRPAGGHRRARGPPRPRAGAARRTRRRPRQARRRRRGALERRAMSTDPTGFSIAEGERGGRAVVVPRGELDLATAPQLDEIVQAAPWRRAGRRPRPARARVHGLDGPARPRRRPRARRTDGTRFAITRPREGGAVARILSIAGIDTELEFVDEP